MSREHTVCIPHTQFPLEACSEVTERGPAHASFWRAVTTLHPRLHLLGIELLAVHMGSADYTARGERVRCAVMVAVAGGTLRRILIDVESGPRFLWRLTEQIVAQCGVAGELLQQLLAEELV